MSAFHEVLFPPEIAFGSSGGPQRLTDIVTTGSGREERNQRWFHSRRRYNAGYGIKTLAALAEVIAFFEARRGRLYGFRWHDRADHLSCAPGETPSAQDQHIGTGDGQTMQFQLVKTYGSAHAPYERPVLKPVAGSIVVALNGIAADPSHFTVDTATGLVSFAAPFVPGAGAAVTAGFMFDVPVRFDTDYLEIDHAAFEAGVISDLPVIEIIS